MKVWMYDRGEWKATPNPFAEDEDPGRELHRLGFEDQPVLHWGDEHGFGVTVHAGEGDSVSMPGSGGSSAQAEFFVSVDTWSRVFPVFVADLPSLVQLLGEHRPKLASEREALDFEERQKRGRGSDQ